MATDYADRNTAESSAPLLRRFKDQRADLLNKKRAGKQTTTGSCPVQRILLAIDWHLFHFVSFFCQILYSRTETGP